MMKLAFTVKVPEKSEDFKNFEEKVTYLAKIGYDGVELAIRDPKKIDAEKVKKLIDDFKMKVPTIATGEAYVRKSISLASVSDLMRNSAIERIKNQIELAAKFSSYVTIGLIRGQLNKRCWEESKKGFTDAMLECAEFAKNKDVNLLLEPLNRYETNFLNTIEEARNFIAELNADNVFILADTYHMNIEEKSMTDEFVATRNLIAHIHIADNNRLAPGQGHINFLLIFCVLKQIINYNGFITAEIILKPDFKTAAMQTIDFLKRLL